MQLLTQLSLTAILALALTTPTTATTTPPSATESTTPVLEDQPTPVPVEPGIPPEPDHGVDNSTFPTLWSGDAEENGTLGSLGGLGALTSVTDIPFDTRPKAVETWNQGEHDTIPATGPSTSRYPEQATRSQGSFIRDAYVEVLSIENSTRTLEDAGQTLFVPSAGRVRALTDSRIAAPSVVASNTTRRRASLLEHNITSVHLHHRTGEGEQAEDEVLAVSRGSHRPELAYTGLERFSGSSGQRLVVTAEISTRIQIREDVCVLQNASGVCEFWQANSTQTVVESITVEDATPIEVYDPAIRGGRVTFGENRVGVSLDIDQPWMRLETPRGVVRSRWQFFSMRDPGWDTLQEATRSGTRTIRSDTRPLEVYAFAGPRQPFASHESRGLSLKAHEGARLNPPSLPRDVSLYTPRDSYERADQVVLEVDTTPDQSLVFGLEGFTGQPTQDFDVAEFPERDLQRTRLDLSVREHTAEATVLDVGLHTLDGRPLPAFAGELMVDGQRVPIPQSGYTTVRVEEPMGVVAGGFKPPAWWNAPSQGYVGSTDRVYATKTRLNLIGSIGELVVPIGLFLLGVYLIDRITGWALWPPWRGL